MAHVLAHLIAAPLVLGAALLLGFWPFDDDNREDEDLPTLEEVAERCVRNPEGCDEPIQTKGGIFYIHYE